MDKRELLTPLIFVGLAVAFAVVSALVYLSRGNPGLVRRKLRLGAALLTLTAAANGCGGTSMCYDVAMSNEFSLTDIGADGAVHLSLPDSNRVAGTIYQRQGDRFSFRLEDEKDAEVQRADIVAQDGAFDESSEEFSLAVRQDLAPGTYRLTFYTAAQGDQATVGPNYSSYELKVTHGK